MKKISVSRLACLTAERIHTFYRNPPLETKFFGLHKTVLAEGADTKKNLCMTNMALSRGKEYFITFDEVIVEEWVAYLYIRKTARKGSKPYHLAKSKAQVGLLAAFFELSDKKLFTVRRLLDHGYKSNTVDLYHYKCVFVLDYNGKEYDIVPNEQSCLDWADAKMEAVDDECKAVAFDSLPLPEVSEWEM